MKKKGGSNSGKTGGGYPPVSQAGGGAKAGHGKIKGGTPYTPASGTAMYPGTSKSPKYAKSR